MSAIVRWMGRILRPLTRRATSDGPTKISPEAERIWVSELVQQYYAMSYNRLSPLAENYTEETPEIRLQYRRMLKEPTVKAAFWSKVWAVASQDMEVVPASKRQPDVEAGEFVKWTLQHAAGGTPQMVEDLTVGTLIDGWGLAEKVWQVEERWPYHGYWTFKRIKPKDTLTIRPEVDVYKNVIGYWGQQYNSAQVFHPKDFVHVSYQSLFASVLGISDFRAVYRAATLKEAAIKLRMIFLDKFAGPFLKGTYQQDSTRSYLKQQLALARQSGFIVLPQDAELEVIDLATAASSDFKSAIDDFDREILIGLRGAHLDMMEGQGSNNRGDTTVQKSMSELSEWRLSELVASALNEQVVPDLMRSNYPPTVGWPRVTFGSINPADVVAELGIDEKLQQMGLPVSKSDLYERARRTPPKSPEDELRPASPPPAPSPFPGLQRFTDPAPAPDGSEVERQLSDVIEQGSRDLIAIARPAIERYLAGEYSPPVFSAGLLTDEELVRLADSLASATATAELLGRAKLRKRATPTDPIQRFADPTGGVLNLMAPERALDYFRALVPSLNVQPTRFGPDQRRDAFTLALNTSEVLLRGVHQAIREGLAAGKTAVEGGDDVEAILDAVGVSPLHPQYAEMVYRTNAMDAYNVGHQSELMEPDMQEAFPVWQYLGIRDGREGEDHRPKFGKYYPSTVPFTVVRGSRPWNCRCVQAAISAEEWAELQKQGARVEATW